MNITKEAAYQPIHSVAYEAGKLLGSLKFPLRYRLEEIGDNTVVEMDEVSKERLLRIAERGQPVILASNHRSVDVNLYPRAYYYSYMSVDSFILKSVFRRFGMTLDVLAQYNKNNNHAQRWRRVKEKIGNSVREGAYKGLGYIPVHTSQKKIVGPDGEIRSFPRATYPYSLERQIKESIREGHSLGYFVSYGITDETLPDTVRPGAVLHGAKFSIDVVPAIIYNARHVDWRRTLPPEDDHVTLRIGENMRFGPLPRDRRIVRAYVTEASQSLHNELSSLRREIIVSRSSRQPLS